MKLHVILYHSNIAADQMLYTEKDLEKSMDKIETVNFHQVHSYVYCIAQKFDGGKL